MPHALASRWQALRQLELEGIDIDEGAGPPFAGVPDSILVNAVCCHGHSGLGQLMQFDQLKRREFIRVLGGAAASD